MCRFEVDAADIETRFGIGFDTVFADELAALQPFIDDGLVEVSNQGIHVLEDGRLFVRNVCMIFDAYLRQPAAERRFSRTV